MIRLVRSATIAPGKLGEALVFAKQIAEFFGKSYGVKLEVMMPIGGNPHRVAWRAEYPSLAALEEMQSKMLADPKYLEISGKGASCFIAGSLHDSMWRVV